MIYLGIGLIAAAVLTFFVTFLILKKSFSSVNVYEYGHRIAWIVCGLISIACVVSGTIILTMFV